jgi:DNA (cytosine-5)-methyltransferase 1
MRELALFAGAGGGILGGHLLGWHTVCAVEIDPFCREVLFRRQMDGCLPRFPIWDDVTTFDGRPWRGCVDVISGGFPCQPFSSASRGRRTAVDLWPEMLRIVGEVDPTYVFAENVQRAPIQRAAEDLISRGYVVSASEVSPAHMAPSAIHDRRRFWLVAHSNSDGKLCVPIDAEMAQPSAAPAGNLWEVHRTELLGMDDGVPHRMDRMRIIGNGQIPSVAAFAWRILAERIER